jgi:hypothetical protein
MNDSIEIDPIDEGPEISATDGGGGGGISSCYNTSTSDQQNHTYDTATTCATKMPSLMTPYITDLPVYDDPSTSNTTPITNIKHSNKKDNIDDGEVMTTYTCNTTASSPSSSSFLRSTGAFTIVDDNDLLRYIFSYVGDHQYLFVGSVNRAFVTSYTSLFPNKTNDYDSFEFN